MTQGNEVPQELISVVGSEKVDFAVKAERAKPLKESLLLIVFGTIWTLFSGLFAFLFIGPVLFGREVRFELNGMPTIAGPGNLGPLLVPGMFIVFFLLIGICIVSYGLYSVFKKGGYFVGTPTRLVHYTDGDIKSVDWEQFTGNVKISGNAQKGDITLEMRTGSMVSRRRGPDRYVPDIIYLVSIPNVFEIEQMCRKRIKENDPTPVA